MIIEAWLELDTPDIRANLEDDEQRIEAKLEEDLDIECRLEPEISIEATLSGEYELEG